VSVNTFGEFFSLYCCNHFTFGVLWMYEQKQRGINMPEKDFNAVFSKRLRYYLNKHEMTQVELANKLGVGATSVYNWCNGIKAPRMDKIDAMCDLFDCRRSDLIEDGDNDKENLYYLNDETAKAAQEIFENKELRMLFDVAKDADAEDLRALHNMALALKRKERIANDAGC